MDQTIRFWNRMAQRYSRQPIADEAAYRQKLEITQSVLRPDFELVEFGCGTGSTAIAHAPFVKHITAVDFSLSMLEIARQRARAAGVDTIDFVEGDIETFGAERESCDVVMAMSLLHLLKAPQAAIVRCHEMLKPGGYFISSTSCLGDMMKVMKYIGPLGKAIGLMPHLSVFSQTDLLKMIADAGFSIQHQWTPKERAAVFIVARKL